MIERPKHGGLRPGIRWGAGVLAWVAVGLSAGGAVASDTVGQDAVAPAGVCAESRRTAASPDPDPEYAVAGIPAGRFSAASVAGPGGGPPLAPPPSATTPRFGGIGPCELRSSGCNQTTPRNQTVPTGDTHSPYVPPGP
jgi:hypothetical protein